MDKIQISTNTKNLTIKMNEKEASIVFTELAEFMLWKRNVCINEKEVANITKEFAERHLKKCTNNDKYIDSNSVEKENEKERYKGFMYIKCEHCGKEKGFMSRNPISRYYCECGECTEFTEELRRMYVNCECGQQSFYYTNKTEEMFDVECLECGNLVPIKYNDKKKIYETIR